MPLNIKFSVEYEKARIKNTFERIPWYDSHGYSPRFPKNTNPKTDSIDSIYKTLQNEYVNEDYQKIAKKIDSAFSKIENDFFEKLEIIVGKKIKRNYHLILTKYGVGGSYRLPNKIIYNFAMKSSSINTVMHEIVHLIIEPHITKYGIEQNEKERIVDLVLKSQPIALKNYKMQKRGEEHSQHIDPLFKKYFNPPIDNFFNQIYRQETISIKNCPVIDIQFKKDKDTELVIFNNIKNEYQKLINFFGFRPTNRITIRLVYSRKEMNEYWGGTSTISAMVDNKNPNLIYIFSPLVFEKFTKYKNDYMMTIIIHELAHAFVTEINKRCFAWMNEGLCEYLSEDTKSNIIKKENWDWFRNNQVINSPTISWRETMKHEGYSISHSLVSYIIKNKGRKVIFDLLKIRRVKDKSLSDKFSSILGENVENVLIRLEKRLRIE